MAVVKNAAAAPGATAAGSRTERIFEAICAQVRGDVALGHLKPGDKLPAERDLALRLGSSRTAVREALRSLEIAGVIELKKGVKGGAFIRGGGDATVVTRSIRDMMHVGRVTLESLTESRVLLQEAIVRLACERATDADLDALEASIDRTEQLTGERRFDERRVQLLSFYVLLARATGNEVMEILVGALTDLVLGVLAREGVAPRTATIVSLRAIVAALRARDADRAVSGMTQHLTALHAYLFEAAQVRAQPSREARRAPSSARSRRPAVARRSP
jgi:GntR family transcriptional repressor for pyruvate dehydrogenase complex